MSNSAEMAASDESAVEVVLVNYASRGHIEQLLALWGPGQPVVVVDNSQNTDGVKELVAGRENARYLDGGGQGFARAANLGAFSSRYRYVAFVNPDSRPTTADLESLVQGLMDDPYAVSHAATVTGMDGEVEIGAGGWEPSIRRAVVHAFGLHKIWPKGGIFAQPDLGERCELDWTTGACMVVARATFVRLGGFDELFYVYAEDMSFGRRARRAGLHQELRPDVLVQHGAGRSGAPSAEMLRLRGASFAYYLFTYHSAARAVAILLITSLGYALRAAWAARSHPELPPLYRAFIRGMATRRAFVGGREVATERYREVMHPALTSV